MWIVKLIKKPVVDDFPQGYFPRKVRYKPHAIKLVNEVAQKGGEATATRT